MLGYSTHHTSPSPKTPLRHHNLITSHGRFGFCPQNMVFQLKRQIPRRFNDTPCNALLTFAHGVLQIRRALFVLVAVGANEKPATVYSEYFSFSSMYRPEISYQDASRRALAPSTYALNIGVKE